MAGMIQNEGTALVREALRRWRLFLLIMLGSFFASVIVIRASTPQYEARTTILSTDDAANESPLSLIPGASSILGQRSNLAELEAVIASRRLAAELVKDDSLRLQLATQFSPGEPGARVSFRHFVATEIFGVPRSTESSMVDNLHRSLKNDLVVDIKGNLAEIVYTNPDKHLAKIVTQAVLDHGQLMVRERQREKAVQYQNYILNLMAENANGRIETLRTLAAIVPGAISQAARLNAPTARSFDQIDSINVSPNPVKPRIGLVVAVCFAMGFGLFSAIVYFRRAR